MIRFRLGEILAARNLKRTILSKETGISRNTLSSLSTNSTEMVRLDTIGQICKHLGITPNEFFEYVPFDFEITIDGIKVDLGTDAEPTNFYHTEVWFDCLLEYLPRENSQSLIFELSGYGTNIGSTNFRFVVNFDEKSDEVEFLRIKNTLPPGLKTKFVQDLMEKIPKSVAEEVQKHIKNGLTAQIHRKNLELEFDPNNVVFYSDSALFEKF